MIDLLAVVASIYLTGVVVFLPFAGMLYERMRHDNPPGNHASPIGRYGLAWMYSLVWPFVVIGVVANSVYYDLQETFDD